MRNRKSRNSGDWVPAMWAMIFICLVIPTILDRQKQKSLQSELATSNVLDKTQSVPAPALPSSGGDSATPSEQ